VNYPDMPLGPDASVLAMLGRQRNIDLDTMEYQIVTTVIDGCSDRSAPILDLSAEKQELADATQSMGAILDQLSGDKVDELSEFCQSDLHLLRRGISTISNDLRTFREELHTVEELMTCSHMSPLYTRLSHEVMCDMSFHALVWFYSSLLIVTVCGFVMIMLRSSILQEYDDVRMVMNADTSLRLEDELRLEEDYSDDEDSTPMVGGGEKVTSTSTSQATTPKKKKASATKTPALAHLKKQGDLPEWLK
jgi:hypothetical protein